MRRMAPWVAGGLLGLVLGCAGNAYQRYKLGAAEPVVKRCVNMMGGLERWESVKPIHAKALVRMYDSAGEATVNEQQQVIDLEDGEIEATATVPNGRWTAEVTAAGKGKFEAEGFQPDEQLERQVLASLGMLVKRLRGPLNLLGHGQRPAGAEHLHVNGEDLIRVPVAANPDGVAAYYFDAYTSVLRLVAAGTDRPGGEGTVTVYTYRMAPNGMAFPSRISIMKIGRHVLIGDEPVLEVDYEQVRF